MMLSTQNISQTNVHCSTFYHSLSIYNVSTTETDVDGHLSWAVQVRDRYNNLVITLDYDIDEREWVGECDGNYIVSKIQNPTYAARSLLTMNCVGA